MKLRTPWNHQRIHNFKTRKKSQSFKGRLFNRYTPIIHTDKQIDVQSNKQKYIQTDKQTFIHTDRQTDLQEDRYVDRYACRQTYIQTDNNYDLQ